jgi:phosphatidylserine decarboxylase
MMTNRLLLRVADALNFWLTNGLPRRRASVWMGRLSRYRNRWLTPLMLWVWNRFDPIELADSPPQQYACLRDCFVRPLLPGARVIDADPDTLCSPCDGIVGAHGRVEDNQMVQIKGKPYDLTELVGELPADDPLRNGTFVTIRIKSSMYHRFHAPAHGWLTRVRHFAGDAYNVNPPALRRIDRLYCKNERASLTLRMHTGEELAVVTVAAILVAGIRIHALHGSDWMGAQQPVCLGTPAHFDKGQEMGWFEHGSTIVLIVPAGFSLVGSLQTGDRLYMGQALLRRVTPTPARPERAEPAPDQTATTGS